jgi:hypothetical protein
MAKESRSFTGKASERLELGLKSSMLSLEWQKAR